MKLRKYFVLLAMIVLVVAFAGLDVDGAKNGQLPKPKKRKKPKKPKTSQTELDPLRLVKVFKDVTTKVGPNVIIAMDRSPRMLADWTGQYFDPEVYDKNKDAASKAAAAELGVSAGARFYRRIYTDLNRKVTGSGKKETDTYTAATIAVVDETSADYAYFDSTSRLGLARDGLAQAVEENLFAVRFGLIGMRQGDDAQWPDVGNESPLTLTDDSQKNLKGDLGNKTWKVTVPLTSKDNIDATFEEGKDLLVKAEDADSSSKVLERLQSEPYHDKGIKPFGLDFDSFEDAPLSNLLGDTLDEVERVMDKDDSRFRPCRNTVVILVAGGSDGGKGDGKPSDPAKIAEAFNAVTVKGTTKRVPIFVIALGPNQADEIELRGIAAASGGEFYMALSGNDVALAASRAVQLAHVLPVDFDAGGNSDFQYASPVVSTVDLSNASDYTGNALPNTVITSGGSVLPQKNNLVITSGFVLPGFAGSMRAFRTFKPVADASASNGYKFVKDGTPLWVAHVPGAPGAPGTGAGGGSGNGNGNGNGKGNGKDGSAIDPLLNPGGGNPTKRNLFTYVPGTGMVALTSANAATLRPYLLADTDQDATAIIGWVRALPIGAIISSTPAIRTPPSLEAPDSDYQTFADARKDRRTLVFVGGNNGMLHAIDARTGVEVWGFVPFNHLPKLQTLVDGQGVVYFEYFVDASPKLADVKVNGSWRTYLFVGQGAGGTFYQALDVSDAGNGLSPTTDSEDAIVGAFTSKDVIPLVWSFPDYSHFDHALSTTYTPYGDLSGSATAVEKSVGETWSTPAIGQLGDAAGKYVVVTGSGYLDLNIEKQASRGSTKAGHTLYVLDAANGQPLSSYDVGDDGSKENLKNSLHADPTTIGPADTQFIDKVYIGDTEGDMWRLAVDKNGVLAKAHKVYDAEKEHPIFSSAAVVSVGSNQNYVFFSTGIDTLGYLKKLEKFVLVGVLDDGGNVTCKKLDKKCEMFQVKLEKADATGGDERATSAPVVAGDVVFFTSTTDFPKEPCAQVESSLFAMTYLGGAAYDTSGDGKVTVSDRLVIKEPLGRSTAPFVADRHLYYGTGTSLEVFGDPEGFNNSVGRSAARMLTWREVR